MSSKGILITSYSSWMELDSSTDIAASFFYYFPILVFIGKGVPGI
jgi:hypothetical protein